MDYCNLTLYVPHRVYLPMLDVIVKRLGFNSRSECVARMLEGLFRQEGLLDERGRPTEEAAAASQEIAAILTVLRSKHKGKERDRRKEVISSALHSLAAAHRKKKKRRHP